MGGGSYDREVVQTSGNSSAAAAAALQQRSFHDDLKPMKKQIGCATGTPIVLALDISGSMNEWPRIFYDKLPMFYGQLKMQEYVPDPALSFASFSGGYPLQVTKFCQGIECDTELKKMYMACGGGDGEPYADAAYFYQADKHVKFEAGCEKPFFFFTGDEVMGGFGKDLQKNVHKDIDPDADMRWDDLQGLWDKLKEKYHVFLVAKPGGGGVREEWERILGKDRFLLLQTPKAVVDCILGAIAITSGARTLDEYKEDLKERGQDEARQLEVCQALSVLPPPPPKKGGYSAGDAAKADGGEEEYPNISYGAEVPARLKDSKMEKKMQKINKEGGKRGVEIEGAADMGGLQFFCTAMDLPNGDVDLLYESLRSMNEKSDPSEEERKGGSGRIGKMLLSKDQEDSKLALVTYCPPAKQGEYRADAWMKDILLGLGGSGEMSFGDATTAKAVIKNDSENGFFVLKLKDAAITEAYSLLKAKGLFPDKTDDSDDEYIFGDDDFPSM